MDKIDKLTPVIILITGTVINHICKEKKDLTISDFLLFLSPSIPTVMPILIQIITELIKNCFEFFKTIEYLKNFLSIVDFLKINNNPPIIKQEVIQENNSDEKIINIHDDRKIIQVEASLYFVQFLISYIENNNQTCSFKYGNSGKKFRLAKDKKIIEDEIWEDINVNYGKINIYLEKLKISFKKSYGKITVNEFNHEFFVGDMSGKDMSKFTKLSDFIENKFVKDNLEKFFDCVKQKLNTFEYQKWIDENRKKKGFESTLIDNLQKKCPNIDCFISLVEFYGIYMIFCHPGYDFMSTAIKSPASKINKILMFEYSIDVEYKFNTYNIDTSSSISLYNYLFQTGTGSYIWPTFSPEETKEIKNITDTIGIKVKIQEIKNEKNESLLNFYVKLNDSEENLLDNCKSKIIFSEFQNFIEKIKNYDFTQNSENKIKMFNTFIKRIEEQASTAKNFYPQRDDNFLDDENESDNYDNPDISDESNEKLNASDVSNVSNVSNESDKSNKSSKSNEPDKTKENIKKNKKNKKRNITINDIIAYDYGYYCPNRQIEKKKVPVVITEEINEKYKSIDTLYLRDNDYKKLVNVLSRFKNCTYLYEKYGLPNKLGVLLYGEPGTGKSTTIQVIASFLQKNVYSVDLSSVETNEELQMIFDEINNSLGGGIIVFEDIDAMTSVVHSRQNNNVAKGEKFTLDYFLNLLQGSLTRDGTIFIATTNHIEKLDPAFYRVGRFDVNIEMKKCDHYQIATIFEKFVGRIIDTNVLNKIKSDKYTPAEIIFHLVNHIDSEDTDTTIMKIFFDEE